MTMVFMALVAAMIMERISVRAGFALLPVLLLLGIASVVEWHISELNGRGDLRFYAGLQAYAVLTLLAILLLPPRYTRSSDLVVVVGLYVLTKITRECGPCDFFARARRKWSHHQASCRRRGLLDSKNVSEETASGTAGIRLAGSPTPDAQICPPQW